MMEVGDPGIMSVIRYLGWPGESPVDPGELCRQLVREYEKVSKESVFAASERRSGNLEQSIFSTVLDEFLSDYRKITDVSAILGDFGIFVSQKIAHLRNRLTRSSLIDFFSQFGPSSSFSLPNFISALKNGAFDDDQLSDLVVIEELFFNHDIRFMGHGLLSMIDWETTGDGIRPVYPAGLEMLVQEAKYINPFVWREALRAVLAARNVHGESRFFNDMDKLVAGHAEIDLFVLASQAERAHEDGEKIVIPTSQDEIKEMYASFIDYLSFFGLVPNPNVPDLLSNEMQDARDRSLLLLLDDGLVDDVKLLLKLRHSAGESPALGLLIHAAAAHEKLSGLRKMLFDAALKAIAPIDVETHAMAMLMDRAANRQLEGVFYYLIPLLDFSEEEQGIQDVVTDMNAYLNDYYLRKPHRWTTSGPGGKGGDQGTSAASGSPTPPVTPATSGGSAQSATAWPIDFISSMTTMPADVSSSVEYAPSSTISGLVPSETYPYYYSSGPQNPQMGVYGIIAPQIGAPAAIAGAAMMIPMAGMPAMPLAAPIP